MSDSFALIPKTITGSWGSEWECCNGITTRQDWPFSQRKPGCDRLLPLSKGFLCCLLRAKGVSLCLRLLPKRAEHSRDSGILMTSLERQIQRWVSQIRRGVLITEQKRHGGQLPPHCCLSSSPFCPVMN